jgi:dephospho-CoA kinase
MPKLIVGLVGLQGCGKGTMADLLQKEFNASYCRFSAILSDLLDRLAVEKTRANLISLSIKLREAFGEDVLSHAIAKQITSQEEDIVILDGIRRTDDIAALEPLPNFVLVAITADAKLRFERMKKRGEKVGESDMTWEQFQADESAPTEATIPAVMARARHSLTNEGSREELETKIRALMAELLG